jgi:chemotaxis protein CheZ
MPTNEPSGEANPAQSSAAEAAILNKFSDIKQFYEGIGTMTRMVHSATHNLDELHRNSHNDKIEIDKQPNANFLGYVRELTSDSASKVLDKLEQSSPVIDRLQQENGKYSEEIADYLALHCSKLEESDLRVLLLRVQSHLKANQRLVNELAGFHSDILTLQSYQDLTSQAITKAEVLLGNVESTMANLLKSFANIEGFDLLNAEQLPGRETETTTATNDIDLVSDKAKVETSKTPDNQQLGQDDVDALLSELGF